jgi:DNA-binding transcriptional regulator LsrR (DeoR family)
MSKSRMLRLIEREQGQPLEEILRLGLAGGKTREQIAAELGVSRLTLRRWTRKLGAQVVTTRTIQFPAEETAPLLPGCPPAPPCSPETGRR